MRKAELDEIRALLRAQAEAEPPEPERKGLFGGVKSLLKKPPPKRGPLNLTPIEVAPPVQAEARAPSTPEPFLDEIAGTEADAPMLLLTPKRAQFGLADEGARPAPELRLKLRATPEAFDDLSDLQPRRKGPSLAAIEAAGVGADEILELQDMLAERMPALASQIDFDARLAEAPPPAWSEPVVDDEPSIESVVSALEAVRLSVERTASEGAWAEARAELAGLAVERSPAATRRRQRLARVHADLSAQHADLEGDLQAVRRARSRLLLKAA